MNSVLFTFTFLGLFLGCFAVELSGKDLGQICMLHYKSNVEQFPAKNITDFVNSISELKGVATSEVASDRNIAALFRVFSLYTNNVNFKLSSFWARPPSTLAGVSSSKNNITTATTPATESPASGNVKPGGTQTNDSKDTTQAELIPGIAGLIEKFKEFFSFSQPRPIRESSDQVDGTLERDELPNTATKKKRKKNKDSLPQVAGQPGGKSPVVGQQGNPQSQQQRNPGQQSKPAQSGTFRQEAIQPVQQPTFWSTLFGINPGVTGSSPSNQGGKGINETVKESSNSPRDPSTSFGKGKKSPKSSTIGSKGGDQSGPKASGQELGQVAGLRAAQGNNQGNNKGNQSKPTKKSENLGAKAGSSNKHGNGSGKGNNKNGKSRGKENGPRVMRQDQDDSRVDHRSKGSKGKVGGGGKTKGRRAAHIEDISGGGQSFDVRGKGAKGKVGGSGGGKTKGRREAVQDDINGDGQSFNYRGKGSKGKVGGAGGGKTKGKRQVHKNICGQINYPRSVDSKHDESFREFLVDLAKQSVEIRGDIKLD